MNDMPHQPIDIVPFDPHHATAAQWAAYHAYRLRTRLGEPRGIRPPPAPFR